MKTLSISNLVSNPRHKYIFLLLLVIITYIILFSIIAKNPFSTSSYPYYNYLIDSIFKGKWSINPPETYDLSFYHGKYYMYWGPAPSLFILPFYLIVGLRASDLFYTFLAGLVNIFIFLAIIEEAVRHFKLGISLISKFTVLLGFAFLSPNLYLSFGGKIWHTNQVISITYLLIFLYCYFKFLNKQNWRFLIFSIIFLNLAWLSRYTLISYFILLLYPLFLFMRNSKRRLMRFLLTISLLTIFFLCIDLLYNFARFQSPLETGFRYQVGNPRYDQAIKTGKMFSLSYFPHNFTYYFLNHLQVSLTNPRIKIDGEGNSIFSVYPLLILFFLVFQKKYFKNLNQRIFILSLLSTISLGLLLLLFYLGTGWVQFGNRYFFDVIPLAYLIILFIIDNLPISFTSLLVAYGLLVNTFGTIIFYRINH